MKALLLIWMMIHGAVLVTAQQVIASCGGTETATGYTVDWTLGEPVIETISGSNNTLTQGMHQSNLVVTSLRDLTYPGLEIHVYPNPAGDFLTIEIIRQGNGVLFYKLSDFTGRRLAQEEMQNQNEKIDMRNFSEGIYLIHILNSQHEPVKVYKIIKNQNQ